MIVDERFKKAAETAIATYPKDRNISFSYKGKTYWIKRKMSNGRKQFAKSSVDSQFYREIARSAIAYTQSGLSPEIVYLAPEYMVTKAAGKAVADWLDEDLTLKEKEKILFSAGAFLGKLHEAGMTHGRPAIRDFLYQDGQVTLLDWENKPFFKKIETQKALDYLLLLLSIYREPYACVDLIHAIEEGYASTAGTDTKKKARKLIKRYKVIAKLAQWLDSFHMKDVEAFSKLYKYITA